MAATLIEVEKNLSLIIINAGGNPNNARYVDGFLIVPDVTQAALDGAVAAYNATYDPNVEAAARKQSAASLGLNTPFNQFLFDVLYDLESRVRAVEARPAIKQNQYKNALLNLYVSKL